jgi:hypothetical protein
MLERVEAGYWSRDAGFGIQDWLNGRWILDIEFGMPVSGYWMPDTG